MGSGFRAAIPLGFAIALAIVGSFGFGPGEEPAEAYLFYDNGALDYIVGSDQALRWSEEAWGPGATLLWEIEDSEDWSLLFDSPADVRPPVEEALAIWSGIETADISWRLAGITPTASTAPLRLADLEAHKRDSRNRIFLERTPWGTWYDGAFIWSVRSRSHRRWEVTECDVGLPLHWWLDDDLQPKPDLDPEDVQGTIRRFTAEHFGRCLGLHKPGDFPGTRWLRASRAEDDRHWHRTAVWAPGSAMYWWLFPSADDRVGASLLRPRAGWLPTTGSVVGSLESAGEPVRYAQVYALRRTPDGVRDPVGAFANAGGAFRIEGLPAGDYVLWALPIRHHWDQRQLIEDDAATDLNDAILAHPVRVEAGRITEGITIPMRRGRE